LMEQFDLTKIQASAILDIKLRHLAKLEEAKLKKEQSALVKERKSIEQTLGSRALLNNLIKREINEEIKKFGDQRRSPIKQRKEAEAFSEEEILEAEPVTVVLSQKGWIRSAKGHDFDLTRIKFKSGDDLLAHARTMSNRPTVFLDSAGRAYSLPTHSFPSARSLGEPLTGRLSLPGDSVVTAMLTGEDSDLFLLFTDTGFGFITEFANLPSKNKNGKAVLTISPNAAIMPPEPVAAPDSDNILVITTSGRLLIFPVTQMPVLEKGKGNKIIGIPKDQLFTPGAERVKFLKVLPPDAKVVIFSGKHFLNLKPGNQENYKSRRGLRGRKLPRGYQNVTRLEINQA
ncbi:MAG TPA: DNA gyrase C-terminal beta-propeller domain-containing protein, partial [Desulfobacteraceae bacterium]|nr:DNA gyrase C-terminal beta-propeller domain-containing protein [Desulfobacteraceae bacterium]